MYQIFIRLLELKGCRVADVAKDTGIGRSTFTDWKKGRSIPKADKLQRIADYFGVSLDYLMTGEERSLPAGGFMSLSDPEQVLLAAFRQLNADGQAEAIKDIRKLLYVPEYKAEAPTAQPVEKVAEAI